MEVNKKIIIIISLIVVILGTVIALYGWIYKNKDTSDMVLTTRVIEGDNKWEVFKSYNKQAVIVKLNNNVVNESRFKVEKEEHKMMQLPDMEDMIGEDITNKDEYSKLVWDAGINESALQLKYYLEEGYKEVIRAETQDFIEVYLKNDKSQYKRMLIVQGQFSVANTKEHSFDKIDDYII